MAINSTFPYIKTIHGDLYHFQDNTVSPNEFGYSLVNSAPVEVPGTRTANGTSTTSPYEVEMAIDDDSNTMAVVFDPSTGNDGVRLIKLDGTTFASGPGAGMSVADITPVGANAAILEESLTFSNGVLYFVDGTSTGTLYRAPADGSAVATPVVIPALGTGNAATLTDGELFKAGNGDVYFASGASTTEEDLYRMTAISPAGETVINVSSFLVATTVEEFGDSYDGLDSSISVSPNGALVAFVAVESSDDELYLGDPSGVTPPVQVTGPANFDIALDDVFELYCYDDNNCLFACGTGTTTTDIYNVDNSGVVPVVTNVTQTSGETVPPFVSTGSIDPDGFFPLSGGIVMARDGTIALGPSAGSSAMNLVYIDFATLTPTNVTGDEFGGGTTANTDESSIGTAEIGFALGSDILWFFSELSGGNDDELWSWDASTPTTPAVQITSNSSGTSSQHDNLTPEPNGTRAAVCFRPSSSSGDEEVGVAVAGMVGSFTLLTNDASTSNDVTDHSIRWFDPGSGEVGFFYAQGTNSTANPSDATLHFFDIVGGSSMVIDPAPTGYHVLAVGP